MTRWQHAICKVDFLAQQDLTYPLEGCLAGTFLQWIHVRVVAHFVVHVCCCVHGFVYTPTPCIVVSHVYLVWGGNVKSRCVPALILSVTSLVEQRRSRLHLLPIFLSRSSLILFCMSCCVCFVCFCVFFADWRTRLPCSVRPSEVLTCSIVSCWRELPYRCGLLMERFARCWHHSVVLGIIIYLWLVDPKECVGCFRII